MNGRKDQGRAEQALQDRWKQRGCHFQVRVLQIQGNPFRIPRPERELRQDEVSEAEEIAYFINKS